MISTGILLVLGASALEGLAQVSLKRSAHRTGGTHWRWLGIACALFAIEILCYTQALRALDVAVAYPLSALSYAAVVLCAQCLLGERSGLRRWLGVALIMLGAACALPQ